jgi:hypothetical protein
MQLTGWVQLLSHCFSTGLTLHPKGASCCSMELDFDGPLADRAYTILASLVVPRPIALVTTIGPAGKVNAALKTMGL